MCGITGIVDVTNEVELTAVTRMRSALSHRGPDDEQIWASPDGRACFGHTRLAVLDVSPAGRQPMSTEDGRFTIVFNGEIYNYLELRDELSQAGVRFRGDSDTEVLLEGFARWGEEVLPRLNGMFAFVVWDRRLGRLSAARDRVGKKPLVYSWDGSRFAFASELKALMVLPWVSRAIDPNALELFLSFGYVPAPTSILKAVAKLRPGHYLILQDHQVKIQRYWFPEEREPEIAPRYRDRCLELRQMIADAVRIRLRSDVPVGVLLSGGVDSSVITSECAAQGQAVQAFTVAFDHDEEDLPYASAVAQSAGLSHEIIRASAERIAEQIDEVFEYFDEPFADTSAVPVFVVAREVSRHLKVLLTGDGGDEGFGGYPRYEYFAAKQLARRLAGLAGVGEPKASGRWHAYLQRAPLFPASLRRSLMAGRGASENAVASWIDGDPFLRTAKPLTALHVALIADRHVYLAHDLLYKTDIALMAHGVEGRSPLLDHRLLEWAEHLPAHDLVRGTEKKVLLRDAWRDRLPRSVLDRPKKGFGVPLVQWLRGALWPKVGEHLPCPLLERDPQQQILREFTRGESERSAARIWALFVFAVWARRWRAVW